MSDKGVLCESEGDGPPSAPADQDRELEDAMARDGPGLIRREQFHDCGRRARHTAQLPCLNPRRRRCACTASNPPMIEPMRGRKASNAMDHRPFEATVPQWRRRGMAVVALAMRVSKLLIVFASSASEP